MKHREQNDFLKEIFADDELDSLREDSLAQGLSALRARRRVRAIRSAALMAIPLLALAAALLWHSPKNATVAQPPATVASSTPAPIKFYPATNPSDAPPIATISDEDLLAMFKDRSVGLLGSAGQEKLVFFDKPPTR